MEFSVEQRSRGLEGETVHLSGKGDKQKIVGGAERRESENGGKSVVP